MPDKKFSGPVQSFAGSGGEVRRGAGAAGDVSSSKVEQSMTGDRSWCPFISVEPSGHRA
jgi:hypothetical protein